jgi:hypothetical protein
MIKWLRNKPKIAYLCASGVSFCLNLSFRWLFSLFFIYNISLLLSWIIVVFIIYVILYVLFSNEEGGHLKKVLRLYCSSIGQLLCVYVVSNGMIIVLKDIIMNNELLFFISQVTGMVLSFILGYFLTRYFIFAQRKGTC